MGSPVAQWLRIHRPVQEMWVGSLVQEDPLEKEMLNIFTWRRKKRGSPPSRSVEGSCWNQRGFSLVSPCRSSHTHGYTPIHTATRTPLLQAGTGRTQGFPHAPASPLPHPYPGRGTCSPLDARSSIHNFPTSSWSLPSESKA